MWGPAVITSILSGCLVDLDTYERRKAALTDDDGDGYSEDMGDCDDNNPDAHPNADENCEDVDLDCDGVPIEDDSPGAPVWFLDSDGDGYGVDQTGFSSCTARDGAVEVAGDCDDGDASIYPGAAETWYDGIDQDCDPDTEHDADGDGYDGDGPNASDCDDQAADTHPDAEEVCGDGIDNDCSGDAGACGLGGTLVSEDIAAEWRGESNDDRAGSVVKGISAVGMSGEPAWAVGASSSGDRRGMVYVLDTDVMDGGLLAAADVRLLGPEGDSQFGSAFAAHPDGDWLVVGAEASDVGDTSGGAVFLFEGPLSSVRTAADNDVLVVGMDRSGYLGQAIAVGSATTEPLVIALANGPTTYAIAPDTSVDPVIVTAPADGEGLRNDVVVCSGSGGDFVAVSSGSNESAGYMSGQIWVYQLDDPPDTLDDADLIIPGSAAIEFGMHLGCSGDMNGDGREEVLVGAPGYDSARGAVVVIDPESWTGETWLDAELRVEGADDGDNLSNMPDRQLDLDTNGSVDLLLTASTATGASYKGGAAYVWYGPLSGTHSPASADASLLGSEDNGHFGQAVGQRTTTDAPEVGLGASFLDSNGEDSGSVFFLSGGPGH